MPRPTRYPGIEALPDGRKRIRLRAMDPRTGRMKEVDRVVEGTVENAHGGWVSTGNGVWRRAGQAVA